MCIVGGDKILGVGPYFSAGLVPGVTNLGGSKCTLLRGPLHYLTMLFCNYSDANTVCTNLYNKINCIYVLVTCAFTWVPIQHNNTVWNGVCWSESGCS